MRGSPTLLGSRLLLWVLIGASIGLRISYLANPFELHGISDFHGLGQRMLHGELPYRDFTFEYPPLAAPWEPSSCSASWRCRWLFAPGDCAPH